MTIPTAWAISCWMSTTSFPSLPTSGGYISRRAVQTNNTNRIKPLIRGRIVTDAKSRTAPTSESNHHIRAPLKASGKIIRYDTVKAATVR